MDNYKVVEITSDRRIIIISEQERSGRWYMSPVVKIDGLRMPKVDMIAPMCRSSNVIGNHDKFKEKAISYVKCDEYGYSVLEHDPEITKLYDEKLKVLGVISYKDNLIEKSKEINSVFSYEGTYIK